MARFAPLRRRCAAPVCALLALLMPLPCAATVLEILAAGDVTLAGRMQSPPLPLRLFSTAAAERVAQAQAFLWNCESAAISSRTKDNTYIFLADGSLFPLMRFSNTVAITANNHVFDGYQEGAAKLMELLQAAGITQHGLYHLKTGYKPLRLTGPAKPALYLLTGSPMSQIGSGPQIFTPGYPRILEEIRLLRATEPQSIIITYSHDGMEGQVNPTPRQRQWADSFARAGADVILFSHSHLYGGIEILADSPRQTLVAWGLGNFLFGGNYQWQNHEDVRLLSVRIDTRSGLKSARWIHGHTRQWCFYLDAEQHDALAGNEKNVLPAAHSQAGTGAETVPPRAPQAGLQPDSHHPHMPQPMQPLHKLPMQNLPLPYLPLPPKLPLPQPVRIP